MRLSLTVIEDDADHRTVLAHCPGRVDVDVEPVACVVRILGNIIAEPMESDSFRDRGLRDNHLVIE